MEIGKLDSKVLERVIFKNIKYKRPEVLVRAGIGEDCATLDYGDYDCVVSTDPITASVKNIGSLAVHISCNDVASNGVEPVAILLAVLLPTSITEDELEMIMQDAGNAARDVGVEIVGGHTEISDIVNRPVIVSTALGRAVKGKNQISDDMEAEDVIFITKNVGMEGTGIIVSEREEMVRSILTDAEIVRAKDMLNNVSVVKEGVLAGRIGTHGLHDITEGGILGAVWEMCSIKGLGCEIFQDKIPVDEITVKLANSLGFDWKKLISSGSMMIVVPKSYRDEFLRRFKDEDIAISEIGCVKESTYGMRLIEKDGTRVEIEPPGRDEIYRILS